MGFAAVVVLVHVRRHLMPPQQADASPSSTKPVILITGASGNLGRSIAAAFTDDFQVVGMDRTAKEEVGFPMVEADLSSDEAVAEALQQVADRFGRKIAAVIHLIAFF